MPRIDLNNGKVSVAAPAIKVQPPGRKLKNWLMEYGNYTAENEAPAQFHLWCGLGTIAGAVQRKVRMVSQYFEVLSNMYVILVAPPGTARKTTALKLGQGILKEVPGVHFTTKASSPAALIKQFAELPTKEHQSLTAYSYELGSFFSTNPAEMVDITTDLYDGNPDWDKQTVGRGLEKIPRPWFNLLAATTPQWLGDYLSPTAVEGGFVSRSIFVYAEQRKLSNPFPQPSEEHKRLKQLLVNDLTHISTLEGDMQFTEAAKEWYAHWYQDAGRFPTLTDNRTSGYYERKHIHMLKVAMALSIAESDSLLVDVRDLELAKKLLGDVEPGMKKSFSSVGRNIFATDIERILHQITATGKISYAQLIRANYHALEKKRIDEILQQLMDMNAVKCVNRVYSTMDEGQL